MTFAKTNIVMALITTLLVFVTTCSPASDGQAGPDLSGLACSAIESQGDYAIASPVASHIPDSIYPVELLNQPFTAREAELFRHIAFEGSDDSTLFPHASIRWNTPIVAFIIGSQPFVDVAVHALTTTAGIAEIQLEITNDLERVNFTICPGISYSDYSDTLLSYGNSQQFIDRASWGVGLLNRPNFINTITTSLILTTPEDGSQVQLPFETQVAIVWEEIVQEFGLLRDFSPNEFNDLPGTSTSLFIEDNTKTNTSINELDARLLHSLYRHIQPGRNWDQALEALKDQGLLAD
ncbi:MAG: hypothetical protein HOC77_08245 [Chloroflexi bacterium]|jgi:hypothetical protein|nr:hypothetical protein [Chloroflexota bacterium]MBT4072241.1 hypothetical protein [Chloroflexota bacterium]MBT4515061.1 hypothetical protein [Chloroflexota bacterium]MBT5318991.1 hypothetical protein [Chloroflexota bacterium]MBT6681430.1 hypothetical protein [Chloroflexota bacterium]